MPALSAVQSSCAFASPDPLDQAIQQELAALAAAAATHRSACRWLDEWSGPEGVKARVAHRIEDGIGGSRSRTFCVSPNCISTGWQRWSASPQLRAL